MEIFKTIEDFENYEVSNYGNVRNIKKNKFMSIYPKDSGYLVVKLSSNGKAKECRVHRLVAKAFIDNPHNYDCVNHKDENKTNNRSENLEWCDHLYNNTYGNRIDKQSQSLKEYHKAKHSSKDVDGTLAL